jgi:hypothetical protein
VPPAIDRISTLFSEPYMTNRTENRMFSRRNMLGPVLPCLVFVFGHSGAPAIRVGNAHIEGTVRNFTRATVSGAEVRFEGDKGNKVAFTNSDGFYKVELAPGLYTMIATDSSQRNLQEYRRPLFSVPLSKTITLNVTLDPVNPTCDVIAAPPGWDAPIGTGEINCGGSDSFPLPSQERVPFELLIRYRMRQITGTGFNYNTDASGLGVKIQVFVAYNLFTLRADNVVYDTVAHTLKARGDVVTVNETGSTDHADSMLFKLENGRAILLRPKLIAEYLG